MPKLVMKPQTKNVTIWPPKTWDHASQPPLGGGSTDEARLMSKVDVEFCFEGAAASRACDDVVSIDRYVS